MEKKQQKNKVIVISGILWLYVLAITILNYSSKLKKFFRGAGERGLHR